jgi:HD-GYP domain-containing protein (c-di-GMP phosphodiesterase class II)
VKVDGQTQPLISDEELGHLLIERGTLTEGERRVINGHMVHTIDMLDALPFPPELARVPEYATGHHERMDGRGYPRGLHAGTMSIPARVMAIADTFEALTAADRPYKRGMMLSETLEIMGGMKRNNHLDPELFDLFVRSKIYLRFAHQELPPSQIDDVDEARLISICPLPLNIDSPRRIEDTPVLEEYEAIRSVRRVL